MASKNPYDRNNHPGKFDIVYAGKHDGHYAFRVALGGHKSMDALMFETQLSRWCHENATGNWFKGNKFEGGVVPKVPLDGTQNKDTFVLFDTLVDVVMFEQSFPVTGLTPTSFVP